MNPNIANASTDGNTRYGSEEMDYLAQVYKEFNTPPTTTRSQKKALLTKGLASNDLETLVLCWEVAVENHFFRLSDQLIEKAVQIYEQIRYQNLPFHRRMIEKFNGYFSLAHRNK